MADIIDNASSLIELQQAKALEEHLLSVAEFDQGAEGECDFCGNYSGRLVEGACSPCRDKYKLK